MAAIGFGSCVDPSPFLGVSTTVFRWFHFGRASATYAELSFVTLALPRTSSSSAYVAIVSACDHLNCMATAITRKAVDPLASSRDWARSAISARFDRLAYGLGRI